MCLVMECHLPVHVTLTEHLDLDLLGLDWIESLHLQEQPLTTSCDRTSVNDIVSTAISNRLQQKFPIVFTEGLGLCTRIEAELILHPNVRPVFRPKRPVPHAVEASIDQELSRLETQGIITPVNYSKWAAPIVVIKKPNGTIRLCADFSTGLNAALEEYQYPLPIPRDLFSKLNGGKVFAKIDLAEAYLQVSSQPRLTRN